jgi:magnesium transporter
MLILIDLFSKNQYLHHQNLEYSMKNNNHQRLNRKKKDPNQFIFTGKGYTEKLDIQLFKYNADRFWETKDLSPAEIDTFDDEHSNYWLNVYGLHAPEAIAKICKKLQIHDLVIQDILDVNQRPKFQEYDDYCFFTIKSIVPSSHEVDTDQISFVFGKNYLISFQERRSEHFEHLRFRIRENTGILRTKGPDYLLFTMLESILDNYFQKLQQLEDDSEDIDFLHSNTDSSPLVLRSIERNKKLVHKVSKAIKPIKEFTLLIERNQGQFIDKNNMKYFLEIKDLCLTLLDNCDTLEASLTSNTNMFFSVQNHRMNQVMKTLTMVTVIFIPLTFIAGIYGMNFQYMPELSWRYGYLSVLILFIILAICMVYYFKKKKWF